MGETLRELSKGALNDLEGVFASLPEDAADPLIEAIVGAKRIVVFGCGREGLQMRGFAMRLFHMGRDVSGLGRHDDAARRPRRPAVRLRRTGPAGDRRGSRRHRPRGRRAHGAGDRASRTAP